MWVGTGRLRRRVAELLSYESLNYIYGAFLPVSSGQSF